MVRFKGLLSTLKAVLKGHIEEEKNLFVHESYSNAELPREFRINMHPAFGCLLFFIAILVLNILIFILVKV